jgi:hypothetical protein
MSTEEPGSPGEHRHSLFHRRALHNLLGVPDERRMDVSYVRTPPPVELLDPTPRVADGEEPPDGQASFRRGMTLEPQHTEDVPVQSAGGTRSPFEPQLDVGATPQRVQGRDHVAEDVIVMPAPPIVRAPAPERHEIPSAVRRDESEPLRANQAREPLADRPRIRQPAIETPARVQSLADRPTFAPDKRAAASTDPALTRDRGVDRRRQFEYSAGGDQAAIEHLRQTVKALAAKMAQSHGRTQDAPSRAQPDATPATAPPAAPQRAGISPNDRWQWRPSGRAERSGPARAFWQRNYLTRRSF